MSPLRVSGILLWIVVLWVMLWGELSAANVLSGAIVGVAVLASARLPRLTRNDQERARVALLHAVVFGAYILLKLVEANLVLAWEIITPRNRINTGIVAVPLRTESNLAMMVVVNVITLTPGTIAIEVEGPPSVVYVNVLHLRDVEEVRRELLHIERLYIRAFGSDNARAQLVRGVRVMIAATYLVLAVAGALFVVRLLLGPSVPDRVIALDGLLVTVMCGVLTAAVSNSSSVGIDAVLVVALLGFIGTGVVARYVERRGG